MANFHQIVDIVLQENAEKPEKIDNSKHLKTDLSENPISSDSNKTKKQKLIFKYFPKAVKIRTAPCTNINNMNCDCLAELFRGQFTLQQLMHLRRVCVQWQTIIERLFARKRFLKIFIQKDTFVEHFRAMNQMAELARMDKDDEEGLFTLKSDANGVDDVLVIKNLRPKSRLLKLTFVSTLFPAIQYIFIVFPKKCSLHNLPPNHFHSNHDHLRLCDMLAQWPKLRSLSLKDISTAPNNGYGHWFESEFKHSLWQALPQLSSLHLFGKCAVNRFPVQVILPHLKRLTISVVSGERIERYVRHDRIVELLHLASKCTRLISIGSGVDSGLVCDECLEAGKDSKDNTQLTHLTFVDRNKFFRDFSRFKVLTCLDVNLVQNFKEFIKILEKSTNLTELRIKLSGLVEMSYQKQNQLTINLKQHIPALSSITILHLRVFNSYLFSKESPDTDRRLEPTFLKALPRVFPNLKTAKLVTVSPIVKDELEMCFKSRGPNHFPLLKSVEFLLTARLIDLDNYDGPYRELLKS